MNLLEALPDHNKNTSMVKLQNVLSSKINGLAADMGETMDECFINTASKLLSRYEKIYGINVDVSKSDEFRRERIRAKIRGIGTVTKQMIVDTAKSYSNGDVEIIEDPANYSFKVKFVGTLGTPANMDGLTMTIEEIKPAHLSYTFEYVYRTHGQLHAYTHDQLHAYTHQQIREGAMA
jgi:uncharacterized protein YmfQ (DUF2313 family)